MTLSVLVHRSGRLTGAVLVAVGLLAGMHAHVARADNPGTPIPLNLERVNPTTVRITWRDTADDERGFEIDYYAKAQPHTIIKIGQGGLYRSPEWGPIIPGIPGRLGIGHYDVGGLTPDTAYCFYMRAWNESAVGSPIFGLTEDSFSDWSGTLCIETEALPPPPPPPPANGHTGAGAVSHVPPPPPPPSTPARFTASRTCCPARNTLTWADTSNASEYLLRAFNHQSHAFVFQQTLAANTIVYDDTIGINQQGGVDYELSACNVSGCSAPAKASVTG